MRIGILGATGAVGRQMIECLEERRIIPEDLRLFASAKSAGTALPFRGEPVSVREASAEGFRGLDYVLGAVAADLAKQWAPAIHKAGAVFIDNSSAFRLDPAVPLVVPEINGKDALAAQGIIANPNCSTAIALMAIAPIHRLSRVRKIIAATYQAVSGAGMKGISELRSEIADLAAGKPARPAVFPGQIAYNCLPWIGSPEEGGYTTEEVKMLNEGRKILHAPGLRVTCTCVRVPVLRSHSIALSLDCEAPVAVSEAEAAIARFPGDVLVREGFPTPLEATGLDQVYVGRIRKDQVFENGLALFCAGDQLRKGAAANAVEILEYLLAH